MLSTDKHRWMSVVSADRRFGTKRDGGSHRFLAAMIVHAYVRIGDDLLCVRQVTVVDRFGVSERFVRETYDIAKRLGYLDLTDS